jgi:hypothetical protein
VGVHLEEIRKNIETVLIDQIIDGLTRPGAEGKSPRHGDAGDPGEMVCRGTFDEVNRFFLDKEWSDGLPIVPPTMDRIEKFLKYSPREPDAEIAVLPQSNLKATPFNIAANAVIAGCRPAEMPLFIAAVEAIGDENYNLNNIGTTWGVLPYLLINGPIVRQLKIEYAGQLISKGPNPSIGRALGLIVRNIAGYRPGRNYMGTFGYPGRKRG